jgi:hypothetical protein
VHVDGWRIRGVGEPLDVGQAGLGGEVRLGSHTKDTDDGPHLRQRPRRCVLDGPEHSQRAIGLCGRQGLASRPDPQRNSA